MFDEVYVVVFFCCDCFVLFGVRDVVYCLFDRVGLVCYVGFGMFEFVWVVEGCFDVWI